MIQHCPKCETEIVTKNKKGEATSKWIPTKLTYIDSKLLCPNCKFEASALTIGEYVTFLQRFPQDATITDFVFISAHMDEKYAEQDKNALKKGDEKFIVRATNLNPTFIGCGDKVNPRDSKENGYSMFGALDTSGKAV